MTFLTLEEYWTGAKKIMTAQNCGYLTTNDDYVADVAHKMMRADQTWDGTSSRNTWRYNQAKYAIMKILHKRKLDATKPYKMLSLDYGWDDDIINRDKLVDCVVDDKQATHKRYEEVLECAKSILGDFRLKCFLMYYVDGYNMAEIGEKLGYTKSHISFNIIQSIKKIQTCMLQQD